jgi:DNA-binding winged helix-turn-helix (wHTH) protein
MEQQQQIAFGPFRFERATQRLWQGKEEMQLRPRTRAVLQYLADHPWRLISRQEFEDRVWG